MSNKPAKTRLIVTVSDEPRVDIRHISAQLEKEGFVILERLEFLNCLLGEYDGDQGRLTAVEGVIAVEPEGRVDTQD